jgi:hypothetical protein
MPKPTSSKNRSESVPLQVHRIVRAGVAAPGSAVDTNLVRALSANSFLFGR